MPKLPTFTADRGTLPINGGRRASAPDMSAGIAQGRALSKLGDDIISDAEERESREALVASTEIRAKYARELDAAKLDGRDTDKLKQGLQDDLSKVGERFSTKRGVQSLQVYSANTELMFDEQANAIRVQRAASHARLEGGKFLNNASEIMRSNPLYLGIAEKDAEAFVATLKNISPEQRAEIAQGLKKELNMAAAVAHSRIDPEDAKRRLEAGEWDLTPQQREMAASKAQSEIGARRAEEAHQRAVAQYEERERDDKARDKHFASIMGNDPKVHRAIMDDADLRPQTREHLIVFLEARAKEKMTTEKKSDQAVMRNLWMRIHAPDNSPDKIYNGDAIFEAVKAGTLNTTDANNLNTLVANQKDENNRTIGSKLRDLSINFSRAVSADPRMMKYDAAQKAEIMNDYTALVFEKVAEKRAANKSPSELFEPGSKEYVGSAEFMKQAVDRAAARITAQVDAQIPTVNSQAEYDALPEGTPYKDSNGNRAVKKGRAKAAPTVVPTASSDGSMSNVAAP